MMQWARLAIACAALLFAGNPLSARSPGVGPQDQPSRASANRAPEIFYQIFMRSFRDSNGDRIGDLRGLIAGLDYVKSLGATSVLLTPLQPSPFYHNYFATDFEHVDPAFGSMKDYFAFVWAAHARGLKVYLDQEIQYVAEGHRWLDQARGRPNRPFGSFVLWNKPGNEDPEPFLNQRAWQSYDGRKIGIAMVDLRNPEVVDYFRRLFLFWTDPHGDGSLRDGVDGFRIDHMMDDLDNKHRETNLFAGFWAPIFAAVRERNPSVRIIAEQSDWGYGEDWLRRGGADLVFAFPLRSALTRLDKTELVAAIRSTEEKTPVGKGHIVFIENHDTDRYMSIVKDAQRARIGAAFNILLKGEPLIYYGQELGMRGRVTTSVLSDSAHIPLREAFRWKTDLEAKGSAIWYRGDKPWWSGRYNRSSDGVSVEEETKNSNSLLAWYRALIALRSTRPEIERGTQAILCDGTGGLVCILRQEGGARTLLVANLGHAPELLRVPPHVAAGHWTDLMNSRPVLLSGIELQPEEVRVLGTSAPMFPQSKPTASAAFTPCQRSAPQL